MASKPAMRRRQMYIKKDYQFNFITGAIIIIFQILMISYIFYITLIINIRSKKNEDYIAIFLNTFVFSIPIILSKKKGFLNG